MKERECSKVLLLPRMFWGQRNVLKIENLLMLHSLFQLVFLVNLALEFLGTKAFIIIPHWLDFKLFLYDLIIIIRYLLLEHCLVLEIILGFV
jgi:hypothetical protein